MDWSKGYSVRFYATFVDPDSWRDVKISSNLRRIEITGGSIKKSLSDLRESADIDCVRYPEVKERWMRIWLDVFQENSASHIPLFTGLATSPSKNINGNLETNSLQCYSVLKPAQDILLPRGWYAPKDMDVSTLILDLLKPTKVNIIFVADTPKLKQAIIAENNENNLSMIDKILNAINWRMTIEGDGTVRIWPLYKNDNKGYYDPVDTFDSIMNDILEPSISVDYDWFSCPNVFRAVSDNVSAEARDDDPYSIFSTVSRGREVWQEETSCNLNENETIAEYAQRRLKESQQIAITISYDRRFKPNIHVTDIVKLNYPRQGLQGNFLITSQTINFSDGINVSEEVVQV